MKWSYRLFSFFVVYTACSTPDDPSTPVGKDDAARDSKATYDGGADLWGSDRGGPADFSPSRPDGPFNLGAACTTDGECSSELTCAISFPSGMCTRVCNEDKDCGDLRRWGCMDSKCHPLCDPRAIVPCREGYACRLGENRALCAAACSAAGCAPGWSCDTNSGLCIDPSSGILGSICGDGAGGCDGIPNGICLRAEGANKGFCTLPCALFTVPCPQKPLATNCLLGDPTAALCAIVCGLDNPCSDPEMACVTLNGGSNVCLPQ